MAQPVTVSETFRTIYTEELRRAVEAFPDDYPWAHRDEVIHGNTGDTPLPRKTVESVAAGMLDAVARGSYNKDGRAFKATCKRLGISYTYAAITAYLTDAAR